MERPGVPLGGLRTPLELARMQGLNSMNFNIRFNGLVATATSIRSGELMHHASDHVGEDIFSGLTAPWVRCVRVPRSRFHDDKSDSKAC